MSNDNWNLTVHPAYCDYIAHLIAKHLKEHDFNKLLDTVGKVRFDLDAEGAMLSTTKRISVVDVQGKTYTISIEEKSNGHSL